MAHENTIIWYKAADKKWQMDWLLNKYKLKTIGFGYRFKIERN